MPNKQSTEGTFSSREVAAVARVTLRQLQWWDEQHVIEPVHVGHSRHYSEVQLLEVVAVAALRRHGLSLQFIRKHLRRLRVELRACSRDIESGTDVLLLISGNTLFVIQNQSDIKEHMANSKSAWHLVSMQRELNQWRKKAA